MEWPPCASSDTGRVPCTLARPATGAGAATLAAEAAAEGVRVKREKKEKEKEEGAIDCLRSFQCLPFPFSPFSVLFLSLVAISNAPRGKMSDAVLHSSLYFDRKTI